ncbi:hypothetical protein V8J88_03130 [Massilia sp. W12]|uniref:hypothetical protein n=1 Tax=Massilia sp. W12 TaxID=3126507 RepID=UPI0030D50A5E
MKLPPPASLFLQLRLRLPHLGWLTPCALLGLALALYGWQIWLPQQHTMLQQNRQAVEKIKAAFAQPKAVPAMPAKPQPVAERNLVRFYDALGERSYVEQQVNLLFGIAERAGLTLRQGEYKLSFNKAGGFYHYQITLPVKGTYGQLRQFCEQTLLQIPFAALDEISFKREIVANRNLEARLRLSLYLGDADSIAEAMLNAMLMEAHASRAAIDHPAPQREKVIDPKRKSEDGEEENQ